MAPSTTDFIETALITGGAGGIGKAIAQYLISKGKQVIIVGRTESSLKQTSQEIGAKAYYTLDTGNIDAVPSFVQKVTKEHPDVNCLINNAGVSRPFQFPGSGGTDYSFDLDKADQEIDINIRGPMHLIINFLPHFNSLSGDKKAVIVNVSSLLGYVPYSIINPTYNATKSWVHFFTLNLRTQMRDNPKYKIVELVPPQVATDLHRERVDPDDNKKSKSSTTLSVEEFLEEVSRGLENGDDTITAGAGHEAVDAWNASMGVQYRKKTEA